MLFRSELYHAPIVTTGMRDVEVRKIRLNVWFQFNIRSTIMATGAMRMLSRTGVIVLLALLGIFLVFFFPASCGPFSVTNGPATAFRALAAARGLFAAISTAILVAMVLRCVLFLRSTVEAADQLDCGAAPLALRC
jgi:hypothetical protein